MPTPRHGPGPGGYANRFPGGCGHENRHHSSAGRGRGRGEDFGQVPPPNFPSNSPPRFSPYLPPGQFPNTPRHSFAADYPYENEYMGYSGRGAAAGHWSPLPTAESGTPEQQQLQQQQEGMPPAKSTSATATLFSGSRRSSSQRSTSAGLPRTLCENMQVCAW